MRRNDDVDRLVAICKIRVRIANYIFYNLQENAFRVSLSLLLLFSDEETCYLALSFTLISLPACSIATQIAVCKITYSDQFIDKIIVPPYTIYLQIIQYYCFHLKTNLTFYKSIHHSAHHGCNYKHLYFTWGRNLAI